MTTCTLHGQGRPWTALALTCLLSILLTLARPTPAHAAETYNFLTRWGSLGTGDGQFSSPFGVAVDSSGNVYVADTNNHRIQVFQKEIPDSIAPSVLTACLPEPNGAGWNNTDVQVTLGATDNDGGSGVKEIRYTLNGGPEQTVLGAMAMVNVTG